MVIHRLWLLVVGQLVTPGMEAGVANHVSTIVEMAQD